MTHRWLAAPFILIFVIFGAPRSYAQTNEQAQNPVPVGTPAPLQKIVSKDPLYLKLLNPPKGNDFLQTYSKAYRDALAEVDANAANITDQNLRNQTRNDEWAKVSKSDGDKFWYEAETTFREAKISFSRNHKDGWFEAGRVYYDPNNSILAVATNSTSTTPIDASYRFPMKAATLNQVYEKFHQIAAQEIDQKAHEYVSKSGAGSNCSRNPDWCYNYAKPNIEETLRSERIVVVAQGDAETSRIDRLLLVDRDTETILLNLDAPASTLSSASWRFSIGPVPVMPKPAPTEAEVQPTTPEPPAVSAPANVTAASIVDQPAPEYPPEARDKLIQGEVVLHAIIDKEGKISKVQVLSGDDMLAKAAVEAVRQWRYKPMLVDGEAREVDTTITVTFSLNE
jgi:TonB family protein